MPTETSAKPVGPYGKLRLSRREREILALTAWGYGSKHIALLIGRTVGTVYQTRHRAYLKIGARNQAAATRWAIANGFVGRHAPVVTAPTPTP
jgi:DNA-binding CsgD family transcriptional regulator